MNLFTQEMHNNRYLYLALKSQLYKGKPAMKRNGLVVVVVVVILLVKVMFLTFQPLLVPKDLLQ